ncbi:unnamed protein product [Ixodes pacificus]
MNVRPTNLGASEVFLVARVPCICLCQCSTVVFLFFFFVIYFLGTMWACLLVALAPFYYCMKIMEIFFSPNAILFFLGACIIVLGVMWSISYIIATLFDGNLFELLFSLYFKLCYTFFFLS